MRNLKATFIAAFAALVTASPAFAGEIDGTVSPVLPSVSLSVGGSQPAASYTVTLTNTSNSSALNVGRLVGTTSVSEGATDAKAVFRSSTIYPCTTTNSDNTSIDCNVGSLAVGQSKTFTVTFTAPTSGNSIAFAWTAVFDNGTPPGNSNGDADTATMGLAPISTTMVVSDVPIDVAVTFFTGTGIATPDDPWITKVEVPSTALATVGLVEEFLNQTYCAQAGNLLTCNTSDVSIPAATFGIAGSRPLSQFLEITLLRDASTIAKGAKIDSAVVYYRKLDTDSFQIVADCTDTSNGNLPQAGKPCEDRTQRKVYPSKNRPKDPPVPAGFAGDWQFVIYAVDNGKYNQ
jgi:hypothetical protein